MYAWIIKFITFIGTLLSSLVYNFHKPIKNVKTKRNVCYKKKWKCSNLFDVHYPKDSGGKKLPCIIYFHGGGWLSYSKSVYTTLCRRFASMGYVVFNVNYGLAPLNKIDDIMNDSVSAIKFVQANAEEFGADPEKITLAGDSAGAHIASLFVGLVNSGKIDFPEIKNKIQSLILLYGVFDIETAKTSGFPNIRTYIRSTFNGKGKNTELNKEYSPMTYVSKDFPKVFIASGEIDKLHKSQSLKMEKELSENGVSVEKLFFPKKELRAMHAFMIFDGLETNVKTLKNIEKFLKGVYQE